MIFTGVLWTQTSPCLLPGSCNLGFFSMKCQGKSVVRTCILETFSVHCVRLSLPVLCHSNLYGLEGTQGSKKPFVQTEILLAEALTFTSTPGTMY